MSSATSLARHFKRGQKLIYLPNFVVALQKTPNLPPTFAKFIVPLNFNKLDLRDYLFHAYGVRALAVRSYVQQQKVRMKDSAMNRWYRPRSKKTMTVEMDKPFYWPDDPEDFTPWDKETFDAASEEQERGQGGKRKDKPAPRMEEREDKPTLAEQAKALLSGKVKWSPTKQMQPLSK
ncbi:hypothetical protein EJ06DRAFT_521094 [Trichodelitschia bisporula]|uniref:Large ribosomal subunit protein uL23m n=1 Tax=Trichodelitschia bisporula TaxID=703511 RepID=A0A6G1HZ70_9PEZI|nr:hypothetical protein EJ06DRAFT_521094 [Trichodelitschia bisporula]